MTPYESRNLRSEMHRDDQLWWAGYEAGLADGRSPAAAGGNTRRCTGRVGPPCRVSWCARLAGPDGLCPAHEHEQHRLQGAQGRLRRRLDLPILPPSAPGWHEQAACRGHGAASFYPGRTVLTHDAYVEGRRLCASCPVQPECREAGMGEHHGMWGGLSPKQREALKKRRTA